jgi:hypothetical protein
MFCLIPTRKKFLQIILLVFPGLRKTTFHLGKTKGKSTVSPKYISTTSALGIKTGILYLLIIYALFLEIQTNSILRISVLYGYKVLKLCARAPPHCIIIFYNVY